MSEILNLAVGLGIFLYGMFQLESGAKELSGRRLKNWILTSTRSPVSSALSGTALTALLQSSSLVGLVVLAFASAGAIPLINAVGVLLGANLGTTVTGWLVTFLGFKVDLEQFSLPIIALCGLSQILLKPPSRSFALGKLGLGFGLLLFGLSLMKDSVADLPNALSFDSLQGYRPIVYLLIGTAVTAVIQSSSAMMILTLTALNAGLIALPEAAALVIGADLGTTSTVLLGSLTGGVVKRQLALAHLLFNIAVDLLAFFLFLPFLPSIFNALNLSDPLIGLVAFHSFFNVIGLLIFLPIIKPFTALIRRWIKAPVNNQLVLSSIPVTVPDAALPILTKALLQLWDFAIAINAKHFLIHQHQFNVDETLKKQLQGDLVLNKSFQENYATVKETEGEILQFIARVQQLPLSPPEAENFNRINEITRAVVYSAKTLKDISDNLAELRQEDDSFEQQFKLQQQYHLSLYSQLLNLLHGGHVANYIIEECDQLLIKNDEHQYSMDKKIYQTAGQRHTPTTTLSTELNINREIHHAAKNLLRGLKIWTQLNA